MAIPPTIAWRAHRVLRSRGGRAQCRAQPGRVIVLVCVAVNLPAPLHVTVLVRALDVGARVDRVWRLSLAVGEEGVRLHRDLPFEAGRPVYVELVLPDGDALIGTRGIVRAVAPHTGEAEALRAAGEDPARPRPRLIHFLELDPEHRRRLASYIEERTLPS
jgi:hypothetical protein